MLFRRTDVADAAGIPAHVEHAVQVERRTQIGSGAAAFHTVEHVLAAIVGEEIDDVLIELDASEPPIMDGSARPFVDALERAGIVEHGGTVEYLELRAPVRVVDGDAVYEARPAPKLSLDITIDFPIPSSAGKRPATRYREAALCAILREREPLDSCAKSSCCGAWG